MAEPIKEKDKVKNDKRAARKLAWYANVLILAICLWSFIPVPHQVSMLALVLSPIAAIVVTFFGNGHIELFFNGLGTNKSSMSVGFHTPLVIVAFRGAAPATAYELLNYDSIWIYTLVIFVLLTILALASPKFFDMQKFLYWKRAITFVLLSVGYSYGAAQIMNCALDHSAPERVKYSVTNMEKKKSKSVGQDFSPCFIYLAPEESASEYRKIEITEKVFNKIQIGQTVVINTKKGLLGIPWYELEIQ